MGPAPAELGHGFPTRARRAPSQLDAPETGLVMGPRLRRMLSTAHARGRCHPSAIRAAAGSTDRTHRTRRSPAHLFLQGSPPRPRPLQPTVAFRPADFPAAGSVSDDAPPTPASASSAIEALPRGLPQYPKIRGHNGGTSASRKKRCGPSLHASVSWTTWLSFSRSSASNMGKNSRTQRVDQAKSLAFGLRCFGQPAAP